MANWAKGPTRCQLACERRIVWERTRTPRRSATRHPLWRGGEWRGSGGKKPPPVKRRIGASSGGGFVPQALPAKGSKSRGFILGVSAANGIDAPLRGEEKASAAKPLTPYSVGAASHGSRSRLHEIWRCDRPRPRSSRLREKAASMRVRVPVSATYHMTRCARGR